MSIDTANNTKSNFDIFIKKYKAYIFNSKPYLFYQKKFLLCSYENLLKISENDVLLKDSINPRSFKLLLKKIIEYYGSNEVPEELFVKFNDYLVHLDTLERVYETNEERFYFQEYNLDFNREKKLIFNKFNYIFNNLDDHNNFILHLSAVFSCITYSTLGMKLKDKSILSWNELFTRLFGKNFIYIDKEEDINTDTLYDKNFVAISSNLLSTERGKDLTTRNIIPEGKINNEFLFFTGTILIYFPLSREVSDRRKDNLDILFEYKGSNFIIEDLEEEMDIFVFLLLKFYVKYRKSDVSISTKWKNDKNLAKRLARKWITINLTKSVSSKTSVNKSKMYDNFVSFRSKRKIEKPSKRVFNFSIEQTNNKIHSEEKNIIKNNEISGIKIEQSEKI